MYLYVGMLLKKGGRIQATSIMTYKDSNKTSKDHTIIRDTLHPRIDN